MSSPNGKQLRALAGIQYEEFLRESGVAGEVATDAAAVFIYENQHRLRWENGSIKVVTDTGEARSLGEVAAGKFPARPAATATQVATPAPPAASHHFRSREAAMENPNTFAKILRAPGGREFLDTLPATEREAARVQQAPQPFNIPDAAPVTAAPVSPTPRQIEKPAAIVEGWAPSSQAAAMENPNKFGAWIRVPGNREAFESLPVK